MCGCELRWNRERLAFEKVYCPAHDTPEQRAHDRAVIRAVEDGISDG